MTLVLYRRVSTERQQDEGYGLDNQLSDALAFATNRGEAVEATFTDAISGTVPAEARPGFADMLAFLSAHNGSPAPTTPTEGGRPADGTTGGNDGTLAVVLPRMDRLARDLVVSELALQAIWSTGAVVYDASTGQLVGLDDGPTAVLVRQLLGAVAAYDRAAIVARMSAGRAAKRRAGGYADGAPGYGWRAEAGRLLPDPEEQAGLARMRHLRASGLSLRTVGDILLREGYQPRRAERWHPKVLSALTTRGEVLADAVL